MFTATIIKKEKDEKGRLTITVRFSDDVDTLDEVVKPQDEDGFLHFVKERLNSLNTAKKLEMEDNLNKPIVFEERNTEPTSEQVFQMARFKLIEMKQDVELGLATQAEYDNELAKVIALKAGK